MAPSLSIADVNTLEDLYGHLGTMDMTPGWTPRDEPILYPEPTTPFTPIQWKYSECEKALDAAGRLIGLRIAAVSLIARPMLRFLEHVPDGRVPVPGCAATRP